MKKLQKKPKNYHNVWIVHHGPRTPGIPCVFRTRKEAIQFVKVLRFPQWGEDIYPEAYWEEGLLWE